MKLFVGLGNPGPKYARHRHNVGFMAIDRIAERYGADAWRKRFQGETADVRIGGERVLLLKPMTYMNESGQSVGEAQRFLKIPLEEVFEPREEVPLDDRIGVQEDDELARRLGYRPVPRFRQANVPAAAYEANAGREVGHRLIVVVRHEDLHSPVARLPQRPDAGERQRP